MSREIEPPMDKNGVSLLQPEEGSTDVSLANAKQLIAKHGVPIELFFKADKQHVYYIVEAKWENGAVFVFTGFAWGYPGTGPAGLAQFLEMAQISSLLVDEIPMDKKGKTACSWFRDPEAGKLNEIEWRIIHNALSYQQCEFMRLKEQHNVDIIQRLMDKIRDYKIAPYAKTHLP